MWQAAIENLVINSPYEESKRHFKFTDGGITNDIVEARRRSSYSVPIAKPKKKGKYLLLETEWTQDLSRRSRWSIRFERELKNDVCEEDPARPDPQAAPTA